MLPLNSLAVTDSDNNPPSSLWTNREFLSLWKATVISLTANCIPLGSLRIYFWSTTCFILFEAPMKSRVYNLHHIFHSFFLMFKLQTNAVTGTICLQLHSSSHLQVRCLMLLALRCIWAVKLWVFPHLSSPGRRLVFKMYNFLKIN